MLPRRGADGAISEHMGVNRSSSRVALPSCLDPSQLIRMVEQHPDWSLDQLTAELKRHFPLLDEDEHRLVYSTMVSIALRLVASSESNRRRGRVD